VLYVYLAKGSGGHSSSRGSKSAKAPKIAKAPKVNKGKTVHVNGYTRKDGTYVAPYDRRPPGTADSSASVTNTSIVHHYRRDYLADGYTAHSSVTRDKHGKIKRSKAVRSEFMRVHPCPSTGKTSGRCPGYVVDHVYALECGGPDASSNMQWQNTADAKAKDKTEGQCRI
jgi:hypothetical protein